MLLSFVKFKVKLINFAGMSKRSAVILFIFNFFQGSAATRLRCGGRPCNSR